jgi:D-alanine-D-alanine ligase
MKLVRKKTAAPAAVVVATVVRSRHSSFAAVRRTTRIEIVRCGIPRFSSMGLKSSVMIRAVLLKQYDDVRITVINNESDLALLIARAPDLVFLGFKILKSDDDQSAISIADTLLLHGINFTGSRGPAIELDRNKTKAKQIVRAGGIATADYFTAVPHQYNAVSQLPLPFPLFVKPPEEGGGAGIDASSVIRDFSGFSSKVAAITKRFATPALVETYLGGREYSVAILEDTQPARLLTMPVEIITEANQNGDHILSSKIKQDDSEQLIVLQPGITRTRIIAMANRIFTLLGARDYGRIDIRSDEHNNLYFLEANLVPGLANHDFVSYFTSACQLNQSMNYEAMICAIVKHSLARTRSSIYDTIHDTKINDPAVDEHSFNTEAELLI